MSEELTAYVYGLLCAYARAWGMLLVLPLGERGIGFARKSLLALGLAILADGSAPPPAGNSVLWAAREAAIGMVLGLPCACVVTLAGMLGELFDVMRGQSIAPIFDPIQESQESISAVLLRQLTWVELLCLGIFEQLIGQYQRSFSILGVGSALSSELTARFLSLLLQASAQAFVLFVPFAALFFIIEMMLGFVSKAVPAVGLWSEALQLKSYLGYALMLLAWQAGVLDAQLSLVSQPLRLLGVDT